MKKVFAIALLFVIGFTNLFPASASSQDFGEDGGEPTALPALDFQAASGVGLSIEWQTMITEQSLDAVDVGDVDDDGEMEIVVGSVPGGSSSNRTLLKIINAQTHVVEWQMDTFPFPYVKPSKGIRSVRIGDVDQDGETEFVVAVSDSYVGFILIYNGSTHALERQSAVYDGTGFTSLEIGDVDADGQTEIVVGEVYSHVNGVQNVIVLDGATAAEEWQSEPIISRGVYDIDLRDIDDDGQIEILVSSWQSMLYIFDGKTHHIEGSIPTDLFAITSGDMDQDGRQSIVVGQNDGKVAFYDGKTHGLTQIAPLSTGPITCLSFVDVNQDANPELLVCSQGRLSVYSTPDLALLWRSDIIGTSIGYYNQIPAGQIDEDSDLEIIFGTFGGLYQLSSAWSGPLGLSSISVSPKIAQPGDVLTYKIVLKNQGKDPINAVQVANPLPVVVQYVPNSLTATNGSIGFSGNTVYWYIDLNPTSSATLTYQAVLQNNIPHLPVLSTAQITSAGGVKTIGVYVMIPPYTIYMPTCIRYYCGNYIDRFNDVWSGWPVIDDAQLYTAYLMGKEVYQIFTRDSDYLYLIKAPTCNRQNYIVEVDLRETSNTNAGLVFGLNYDFSQYYMVLIGNYSQTYAVYYYGATGHELIAKGQNTAVISMNPPNHLKVTRDGSKIVLEVNGKVLGSWNDSRIRGISSVGLVSAPEYGTIVSSVEFDNFQVTLLPDTPVNAPEQNLLPAVETDLPDLEYLVLPMPEELQLPGK